MGIRLRELREKQGLSVAQMIERLGVKDSRFRKWESEAAAMPLEYAIKACSILHCSLDELSGRSVPVDVEYDSSHIVEDERRLLDLYRKCSRQGREYLLQVAEVTAGLFGVK